MLRDMYLKGCVKAELAAGDIVDKHVMPRLAKRSKEIGVAGKVMSCTGVAMMLVADVAMANQGIGGWVKGVVNNTGVPVLEAFMWGGYAVGAGMFATGISKFTALTRQQQGATPKEAFGYTGGGGGLMGLGYLADRATESVTDGGSSSFGVKSL